MTSISISTAKFIAALLCGTIICTIGWEHLIKNHLYNCTDDLPLDYLQPGQWVHRPETVAHVSARSMSDPDSIKVGWSVQRLWYLWFSVVGGTVVLSLVLTWIPLIPAKLGRETDNREPARTT